MSILLKVNSDNPNKRHIKQIVDVLNNGGIIIYPTDTLYGLGCDITNSKAVEKIARLKGVKPSKANFSFIIDGISSINNYAKPFGNNIFKLIKKNLPGPFTFILNANNSVPKMMKNNKKTVGIRIPSTAIVTDIIEELGNPLMSTSIVNLDDDIIPYPSDPYEIYEDYKHLVDLVVDGGSIFATPSTVVDCTSDSPTIIRQGKGVLVE